MDTRGYFTGLANQIDLIHRQPPSLTDHRNSFPWLSGALGDPNSGIWFVAEIPSLSMLEIARNPDGGRASEEAQWYASRGDKLFRDMLVKYEFKTGGRDGIGGWKCYITNVIKQADYTKDWRAKTQDLRNHAVDIWKPVFEWELSNSKPKLVVVMGGQVEGYLKYLSRNYHLPFHKIGRITHYAYIGARAQGRLGLMHPDRIKAYDAEISGIRHLFDSLK